ncbi:DeoR/GlpR family DNA-binding transcription regulator [Nocardiopsis coralliicola]
MPPRTRHVIPAERRRRILAALHAAGSVRVAELAGELSVSDVTIRRDLDRLEAEGTLERTHGGGLLATRLHAERGFGEKDERQSAAKDRIGRCAAELARSGETVFVNSGSTTARLLHHLADRSGLRIITTNAAAPLHHGGGSELIVVGGVYRARSNSLVGPLAGQVLRQFHADRAFIGVDGIGPRSGLSTPSPAEGEVARLMIERTRGTVAVVADHTKFGVAADFATAPLSAAGVLVTDSEPAPALARELHAAGVRLCVAGEGAPGGD